MKAIQIEAYGNPTEVVKVVDLPDCRCASGRRSRDRDRGITHQPVRPATDRWRLWLSATAAVDHGHRRDRSRCRGGCAGKTREGRGPDIGAVPPSDLGRARQDRQPLSAATAAWRYSPVRHDGRLVAAGTISTPVAATRPAWAAWGKRITRHSQFLGTRG